jgi:hypothetical protein
MPQVVQLLIAWLSMWWWLIAQPERTRRLIPLQMRLHQNHTEWRVGVLESVLIVPASQPCSSPAFVFHCNLCVWISPRLWFLEGKPVSVNAWASLADIGTRLSAEHPIAAQAYQGSTRFIFQRAKEAMIAVFAVTHDEIQPTVHLLPPQTTQLLDLFYSHLSRCPLAGDPPDRNRWRPTIDRFRYPSQYGVRMTYEDRPVYSLSGTADVLPVGQGLGSRMQPSSVIQRKHSRPLSRDMLDEVCF